MGFSLSGRLTQNARAAQCRAKPAGQQPPSAGQSAHEPCRRCRRESRAAAGAARRAAAAEDARRGFGPGASDRARRRADPPDRRAVARLDDLLGAAGKRQDDGRAADRGLAQRRVRPGFGHPYGRGRTEEDLRRRARAPLARAGHAPVRRRDPSLQPRAAGFLLACDGGRFDHAHRRDDRESLVRAQCVAAVARAGARLSPARARGARSAARTRRAAAGRSPCRSSRKRARRSSAWRTATAARC